jgi:hypothetical protein
MDRETPASRRTEPPQPAGAGSLARPPERAPMEEYGPLAVERYRKDDGRALLLYELREPEH